MQALVDIVDSVTGTVRSGMRMVIIGGIVVSGLILLTIAVVAPMLANKVGERTDAYADKVERLGEEAIKAEVEDRRAERLADDGWGISVPVETRAERRASRRERDPNGEVSGGGWGRSD